MVEYLENPENNNQALHLDFRLAIETVTLHIIGLYLHSEPDVCICDILCVPKHDFRYVFHIVSSQNKEQSGANSIDLW